MKKICVLLLLILFLTSTALADTVNLPKTGQTKCYDTAGTEISCAGTGQDGDIQAGVAWPEPRFSDNGNETMTDNLTGLMWTKDANLPNGTKTWQQALDYVAGMNAGTYFNYGYTDWRLPNVNELESLINANEADTAAWLNGQRFTNVQANGYYWSSTTFAGEMYGVWLINMSYGYVVVDFKFGYCYVWPVRAGQIESLESSVISIPQTGQTQCYDEDGKIISCSGTGQDGEIQAGVAWPSPRFTDNGDGTITDDLTGLMWTKNVNLADDDKTWQQTLDFVKGMNAGTYSNFGYTGWRLPNRKELYSLIDFSEYGPAIPLQNPFNNVLAIYYWSSSTFTSGPGSSWSFSIWDGSVQTGGKSTQGSYYVWPVRMGSVISCTYAISPIYQIFTNNGGTGYINITATAGCCWTATNNASWITITGSANGTGDGTVYYSIGLNTSSCSRTGTISVADQTFTVTQTSEACTYSISPTNQSFSISGGVGYINVTTEVCCGWTATSNAPWIIITSADSGAGNGTVNYSVAANAGSQRIGIIAIGGQTFTVTQEGTQSSGCLSWEDVIQKYQYYVNDETTWQEVITCYNTYVSGL